MPSLQQSPSTTVTTTSTQQVKLSPSLKKKLVLSLKTYTALRDQKQAIESAMKKHSSAVSDILAEAGEMSLEVEGHKATVMTPVRKKLDPKRLIALGISTEILAKATTETPGMPWVKISKVGERDSDDE